MTDFPTEQRQYRFKPEVTEIPVINDIFPSLPALPGRHRNDFYEEDEPVEDVMRAFNAGEKGLTAFDNFHDAPTMMSDQAMEMVVRIENPAWNRVTSHHLTLKTNPHLIVRSNTGASLTRRYTKQGEHRWNKRRPIVAYVFISLLVLATLGGLAWIVTNKNLM